MTISTVSMNTPARTLVAIAGVCLLALPPALNLAGGSGPSRPGLAPPGPGLDPAVAGPSGLSVPDAVLALLPNAGPPSAAPMLPRPIWYRANDRSVAPFYGAGSWSASFEPGTIEIELGVNGSATIALRFSGPSPVVPVAVGALPGRAHWNRPGAPPGEWDSASSLRYAGVQQGIDVVFRALADGLKYELEVAARANLETFSISVEGGTALGLLPDGSLEIRRGDLSLFDAAPSGTDDLGRPVKCAFALREATAFGFACPEWDGERALTIDPLLYSSFVGGSGQDEVVDTVPDGAGGFYIAADTQSADFPLAVLGSSFAGLVDVVVARMNAAGQLTFATYIGGTNWDSPRGLSLDADGNVLVVGFTQSSDFPVTPSAFDRSLNGSVDGFLVKINSSTGQVAFSTYLGGSSGDRAENVAPAPNGSIVVSGFTQSTDFANTTGAYDPIMDGGADVFVSWIAGDGAAILVSTFFGGTGGEGPFGMALDSSGNVVIAGSTDSFDMPVSAGTYQPSMNGTGDAFVAKLSANGSALLFSTYLGGTTGGDVAVSVVLAGNGDIVVAGETDAGNFPTTAGAYDRSFNGGAADAFVARLNANATSLLASTFLGGSGREDVEGLGVDPAGALYIAGYTTVGDFPTTGAAFDESFGGGSGDAFVSKLAPNATALRYSTFLGGNTADAAFGLVVAANDTVAVFGVSGADFPTTPNGYDTSFDGFNDGWFVILDMRVFTIAVNTAPAGFAVRVNGAPVTAPASIPCGAGANVTLNATDPAPSTYQRFVFSSWSDGQPRAHNVTCAQGISLTASFELQYKTTISTSPLGFNVTIDGATTSGPATLWWAAGGMHNVSFDGPQFVSADTRYVFLSWSDGGARAHGVIASNPANLTAQLVREFRQAIEANPSNVYVQVDGANVTNGTVLWWGEGSSHDLVAPTPQNDTGTSRALFLQWADGGSSARTVVADAPGTFAATYFREFLVNVQTAPVGLETAVDGLTQSQPWTEWIQEGASLSVEAPPLQSGAGARYLFMNWSDAGAATHPVLVTGPLHLVASYSVEWQVEIRTEPVALSITVDGANAATPLSRWWADGSSHTVTSPPGSAGATQTRYVLVGWEQTSLGTMSLTASGPVNLTAHYQTEFQVVLLSDQAPGVCDDQDCWYAAGAQATITTADLTAGPAGTRYRFSGWSGDVSGAARNQLVVIEGPLTVTALWTTQYELTINTAHGNATGAGWYDAGEVALVRLQPTVTQAGAEALRFAGWSGASANTEPNISIAMSGARHLTARWEPVPAPPPSDGGPVTMVAVLAAVAGLAVVGLFVARRRRVEPASPSAPRQEKADRRAPAAGLAPRTTGRATTQTPIVEAACPRCARPVKPLAKTCGNCGLEMVWD